MDGARVVVRMSIRLIWLVRMRFALIRRPVVVRREFRRALILMRFCLAMCSRCRGNWIMVVRRLFLGPFEWWVYLSLVTLSCG